MKDAFRRLLHNLPIGAAILTPEQKIRYANPAFSEYIGYDVDELRGRSLLEFSQSYDRDRLEEGIDELFSEDRKYLELETCYVRKDGDHVWGYPVRMLHPNPASDEEDTMLMLVVDITRRRRLEERLRETERMRSLGLLAGSVAHDFNNILTVVTTFVGLLESQSYDADIIDEGIDNIRDACERGKQLTRQLMEFGRRESSTLDVIDINEFLEDLASMFERVLPRGVELELNLSEKHPTVMTDEGRLHQIVMNLILNGRDAIDETGTITVETAPVTADDADWLAGHDLSEGDYTRLRVCDTGPGISDELIPKIFEPYFTTKAEEGTGLGLTTVYGIVKEDKGYIRVDSNPNGGTCFDIFLPASKEGRQSDDLSTGGSRLRP